MSEQRQTYTLDANGQPLTIHQDGATMPADHSFACVNDYVHDTGRHFEELQGLALGMACEIDNLRAMLEARTAPVLVKAATEDAAYQMGAAGAEPTEHERLLFEAWMRGHCWSVCGEWNGRTYVAAGELGGQINHAAMLARQLWAAWRDRAALAGHATPATSEQPDTVRVPVKTLQHIHRDLDACQKVIWLAGCRPFGYGFDPAYVTEAQARLKEIDALLSGGEA